MLKRCIPRHALQSVKSRPPLQHFLRSSSTHISPTPSEAQTHPSKQTSPKVIFSGIQPTGIPHLGNYLGALKTWVKLQNEAEANAKLFFSIVDLHAITLKQDREQLKMWKWESLATLLAIGLRPDRCVLFFQSEVKQHAELMWILSCTASMGYLSRMTQWKSKLALNEDASPFAGTKTPKLGLFSYPVLQAADILVHGATDVPVGEDQLQHLEFTRECATNFNHTHQTSILPLPLAHISPTPRLKSLTDPLQKMSKSSPSPSSRILISDSPTLISAKIKSALTDSISPFVTYDPDARPGVANLLEVMAAFDERGRGAMELGRGFEEKGVGLGVFKREVAECVVKGLGGISSEYERIVGEKGYVEEVARVGALRARENAEEMMVKVREAVGL